MLMAAEGNSKSNNEPVEAYYNSLLKHLGWNNRGLLIAGGVTAIGDIKDHTSLERVKDLGISI